jgi:hypothetical protein
MTTLVFSSEKKYYLKATLITAAVVLLLLKSEQHFSYPFLILALLCGGYWLGKITCSIHLKNASMGLTILVFTTMNLIHSFVDGLSLTGQPFVYAISAVAGHEMIRQPTLYIILWAMLQPLNTPTITKVFICFFAVTGVWLFSVYLGEASSTGISRLYNVANWVGYSVFLFVGDIIHHLSDQYVLLARNRKNNPL